MSSLLRLACGDFKEHSLYYTRRGRYLSLRRVWTPQSVSPPRAVDSSNKKSSQIITRGFVQLGENEQYCLITSWIVISSESGFVRKSIFNRTIWDDRWPREISSPLLRSIAVRIYFGSPSCCTRQPPLFAASNSAIIAKVIDDCFDRPASLPSSHRSTLERTGETEP
jgi:hypothetical protein